MAVKTFFGLPGCGKTTLVAYFAIKAIKTNRYSKVYCNVPLAIEGVIYIKNSDIGRYNICDGLVLIDEGTLFADSRRYKDFSQEKVEYFLLHRHYNVDIFIFTQQWDALDKKIRVITDRVFYVYKTRFFGKWITKYYRIPYGIIIPDPKKGGEKLGEIIQGYCKPPLLVRLCAHRIWRPTYYKYFDSWDRPYRPELPQVLAQSASASACETASASGSTSDEQKEAS